MVGMPAQWLSTLRSAAGQGPPTADQKKVPCGDRPGQLWLGVRHGIGAARGWGHNAFMTSQGRRVSPSYTSSQTPSRPVNLTGAQ